MIKLIRDLSADDHFDKILLPNQYGFPKGYISQHCLLAMLENFRIAVDDGNDLGHY